MPAGVPPYGPSAPVVDQRGDLPGRQCLLDVVEAVEDLRRLRRLDLAVDKREARRADLVAEDVALELPRGVLGRDGAVLERDEGLLHVVVGGGERDGLCPLR